MRLFGVACVVVFTVVVMLFAGSVPAFATSQDVEGYTAFVGDSFEDGYGAPVGQGYVDLMENWVPNQTNFLKIAHGGATVRRYLPSSSHDSGGPGPWYSDMTTKLTSVDPLHPVNTVVIPLGTNDWYIARPISEYKADLTDLINLIRTDVPYGTRIILYHHFGGYVTPNATVCDGSDIAGNPPCHHQSPPASWTAYGSAMRDVAVVTYAGYIDDSMTYQWQNYLYSDHLHPNAQGHDLMFRSLYNRLYNCC